MCSASVASGKNAKKKMSLRKLRVDELRAELVAMGLSIEGSKAALIERLRAARESNANSGGTGFVSEMATPRGSHPGGFGLENRNVNLATELAEVIRPLIGRPSNFELAQQIPVFKGEGNDDVDAWLENVNNMFLLYEVADDLKKVIAIGRLQGRAQEFYFSLRNFSALPWVIVADELKRMFKTFRDPVRLMSKLQNMKWKVGEDYRSYHHEKVILANKLRMSNDLTISLLIDGIDNFSLRTQAASQGFQSPDELLTHMSLCCKGLGKQPVASVSSNGKSSESHIKSVDDKKSKRCFNCGEFGHLSNKCTKPKRERDACFKCGKVGHRLKECPEWKQSKEPANNEVMLMENSSIVKPHYLKFQVEKLNGDMINFTGFMDSGSPISLVKVSKVDKATIQPITDDIELKGVNSMKVKLVGFIVRKVKVEDILFTTKFYVTSDDTMKSNVLLGREFISDSNLRFVFEGDKMIVTRRLEIDENVNGFVEDEVMSIMNIEYEIPDNELKIDENTDEGTKAELVRIYNDNYVNGEQVVEKSEYMMKIDLKDEDPFYLQARRLSYADKASLRLILDNLLSANIIRPSESGYGSPIVMVQKKNGEPRMCVDYRILNAKTKRKRYQLPLIDEILDALKDKMFFSTFDLKNGFYHVKMHPDSVKYTSFVTPFGQFEFLNMPFGLADAPECFQKYMNSIFHELIEQKKIFPVDQQYYLYCENITVISKYKILRFQCISNINW